MPKRAKEWGALDVKRAVHSGMKDRNEWFAVGGVAGLLLQITPGQTKSWLLRTTVGTTRRAIGLGPYPEIGLAAAREKAREAKAKIEAGVDPIEERKAVRAALAAARARNLTFTEAADKWIVAKLADRPEKSQKAVRAIAEYLPENTRGRSGIVGAIRDAPPDEALALNLARHWILRGLTLNGGNDGDGLDRFLECVLGVVSAKKALTKARRDLSSESGDPE